MAAFWLQIYPPLAFLALFIFIFILARFFHTLLIPYDLNSELTEKDNVAVSVSYSGYLLAVFIIFIGALLGPSTELIKDLIYVGGYSLFGVLCLNLSQIFNDKIILRHFCNIKELIEDRNAGVGAVQFGTYVGTGLIIAASVHGQGGGPLTALAFFGLSQIIFALFSWIYNLILPFNLHNELEQDNAAAGLAFGGTLIALGIILSSGAEGNFISWKYNLEKFAITSLIGLILLPVFRIFLDKIILPQSKLNDEISRDRNLGAGILEMVINIGFASLLFFLMK